MLAVELYTNATPMMNLMSICICDERGYRDYTSADTTTFVVDSEQILRKEGYIK